jgi:hypothetical protein
MEQLLAAAARLSDRDLMSRVNELARHERKATVDLLAHLAELDRRKLYRGEGFASLFAYCTGALRLSEHAAYKRTVAARACRRFPVLLERLADASMNLSTVKMLAPHFTRENLDSLISEASGRSKREVEKIVARVAPRPDVAASVRKMAAAVVGPVSVLALPEPVDPPETAIAADPPSPPVAPPVPATRPAPPAVMAPLAPDRYRFQFTASEDAHEMFLQVQALLRREVPDGAPGAIFERALKLLMDETARKKLAAVKRPRAGGAAPNPRSRNKPAELVRAVWRRDGDRCAFVGRTGQRCGERAFIEFHHRDAWALGGEMTPDNISLRCRTHNQYEAELVFGPLVPRTRTKGSSVASTNSGAPGPAPPANATNWPRG